MFHDELCRRVVRFADTCSGHLGEEGAELSTDHHLVVSWLRW